MTTGAKIGIGLLVFAAIAIPVTIIIVRKRSGGNSTVPGGGATPPLVIPVSTPCIPFTKQQQDEQRKLLQRDCAKMQLTPVIGPIQAAYCYGQVSKKLTPISNC